MIYNTDQNKFQDMKNVKTFENFITEAKFDIKGFNKMGKEDQGDELTDYLADQGINAFWQEVTKNGIEFGGDSKNDIKRTKQAFDKLGIFNTVEIIDKGEYVKVTLSESVNEGLSQEQKDSVMKFFKDQDSNNIPDDRVHGLADKIGAEHSDVESYIYSLAKDHVDENKN